MINWLEKEPYETLKSFWEDYEVDHNNLSLLTDSLYNNILDAMQSYDQSMGNKKGRRNK